MKYIKNPCKNCEERHYKCHSICKRYQDFHNEIVRQSKGLDLHEKLVKDIDKIKEDMRREKESRSKSRNNNS